MPTLRDLRLEAHLTVARLAQLAGVERRTLERAEGGLPVLDAKAAAIVDALGKQLGRRIRIEDVEGLKII